MKVIAAYLLAVLGGNANPSADDLKHILGSVGVEADDDMIELLLSQVKGKDLTELIAAGRQKLATVPSGGAASPLAGFGGPATADAAAPPPPPPEAKEEKIQEESDEDMCFSLFD